jgi:RRXRR protein
MPCTPAKARHLFKSGKARPKRNKLGVFYVQLCYQQPPDNQPLVVGVDPGSKFEGKGGKWNSSFSPVQVGKG